MASAIGFGDWLKQQRQTFGWSQQSLAEQLRYSVATIRKIERHERKLSGVAARRLAALLQIAPQHHAAFVIFARTGAGGEHFGAASPTATPPADGTAAALPVPLTSLVGRADSVVHLSELLQSGVRLLTLTGPPGIGKTRLSIALGHALAPSFDAVLFVDLAPLASSELLLPTIAQALDLQASAGQSLTHTLLSYLRPRRQLLILDNFEQIVAAAPHVADLLQATAQLTIVVTSRVPLRVYGEHLFAVAPLLLPDLHALPTVETLAHLPAVQLFLQRAQQVRDALTLGAENAQVIAEIVVQLDGLPLAIELAAARSNLLALPELLQRLDDRFGTLSRGERTRHPRQQTLRAALSWSYELLAAAECALFAQLGSFVGGCTIEAITAVAGTQHHQQPDLLDLLTTLIEHSLLRCEHTPKGDVRFVMLETVRAYALEQLQRQQEADAVQRRHATYFLQFAQAASSAMDNGQQLAAIDLLESEHANIRAALGWACGQQEVELALAFCIALWPFWQLRGHLPEGRGWLAKAAALPCPECEQPSSAIAPLRARAFKAAGALAFDQGEIAYAATCYEAALAIFCRCDDKSGQADLLNDLGVLARHQGEYATATELYTQGLVILRALEDAPQIAVSLNNLGNLAHIQGNYAQAEALFGESLSIRRTLSDTRGIAAALKNLGMVARDGGKYAEAQALFAESLTLCYQLGDKRGIAYGLANLGMVAQYQGDLVQAQARFDASLVLLHELGDQWGIATVRTAKAEALRSEGEPDRAAALCVESLALFRALGNTWGIAWALSNLADALRDQQIYEQALALYCESLALRRDLGDQQGIVYNIEGMAAVAAAQRQGIAAARLLGASAQFRATIHAPLPLVNRAELDAVIRTTQAQVGATAFARAWAEGQSIPMAQIITDVLAQPLPLTSSTG